MLPVTHYKLKFCITYLIFAIDTNVSEDCEVLIPIISAKPHAANSGCDWISSRAHGPWPQLQCHRM